MIKKLYKGFCFAEEVVVGITFSTIVALTFMNVILRRFFNAPIVTADDINMLLFSWSAFLGADVALRYSRLVGMDMIVTKFPAKVQKLLQIVVYLIMIGAFLLFAQSGFELAEANWKRGYNSLPISYSWATLSLPVSCILMTMTCCVKIGKIIVNFKDDSYNVKKDNDDAGLGEENMGLEIASQTEL